MCLTRHKYFLIFLSFIMWRDCTGHRLSEDLNSINTCCCEENCNRENDAQKYNELDPHEFHLPCEDSNGGCCHANKKYDRYDYLKPIINNPEVSSAVKGWYLFVTDYPRYATASELEYLGKLKQGLLTEEELLYPMVPAASESWGKTQVLTNSENNLSGRLSYQFDVEKSPSRSCSTVCCQLNNNKEEDTDYLDPILYNPRIKPAVNRMWLLYAYCPKYAPSDEREYLEKLKQGLLTEEEILYPVLPAMNHEWQETRAADLAERMKNFETIRRSGLYELPKKTTAQVEIEDFSNTNIATMCFHINDDNFVEEHPELCSKLQRWAESFDAESLEELHQRSDIQGYRILPLDYWATVPFYAALEANKVSWLKNILVITDTYDYTTAFNVSMRIVHNTNGSWGPVIVLRINPRKFMDEATRPDANDILREITSVALGYY